MLTLRSGENAIVVAPETGAGVLGWMVGRTPILRRALPMASVGGDSHAMGWFPLVPYCNRIGYAGFSWAGQDYRIARNFGDSPHAIHGIGWQRAWTVADAAADRVALTLDHVPDGDWPFAFHATLSYQMTPRSITVSMAVTNRHDFATPAGLGLHPYFTKVQDPALQFLAEAVWDNGPDALPRALIAVPPDWQHAEARRVAMSNLDNCFTGWNQSAAVTAGSASLRIEASAVFRQVQVFTPVWADFFCVEPVTHVPDAINRPDLPPEQAMHVLRPNETLDGTIRFTLTG